MRWYINERAKELASGLQATIAADHILDHFDDAFVSALTPHAIEGYVKARPVRANTVRRELAVLSAALSHARANNRLTEHPHIKLPKAGAARQRFLRDDEIARLLTACAHAPHLHLWCLIALNTAARKSAILELTWPQVDLDNRRIWFRAEGQAETNKRRAVVPINAALGEILARQERDGPFVVNYHGAGVRDIKKAFRKAADSVGLADVTPHTLRRTAGTIMARSGIDMHKIAAMLGHTYERTTALYAVYHPDFLNEAAGVLSDTTARVLTPTNTLADGTKG